MREAESARTAVWAMAGGLRRGLVLMLALLALGGCMDPFALARTINEKEDAVAPDHRAELARAASAIAEADPRVHGSLLIVAPTPEVMLKRISDSGYFAKRDERIVALQEADVFGWADIVRAGKVFDSVTFVRVDDTETYPAEGYDFKLWWYTAMDARQWYLSRPGVKGLKAITPNPKLPPIDRGAAFNADLVKAAEALGGTLTRKPPSGEGGPVRSIGTGFFIDGQGLALSNAHVVNGCSLIGAALDDGSSRPAAVLAVDTRNDLSLIKVDMPTTSHARLRVRPPVRLGEPVVVYGYPLAGILLNTKGGLSTGTVSALAGVRDDTRLLQISAPIHGGNSGGPVLDQHGNLIGVVVSTLDVLNTWKVTGNMPQNANFAIKVGVVTNFLEANGVAFEPASGSQTLSAADIGDRAKAFTFKVECH